MKLAFIPFVVVSALLSLGDIKAQADDAPGPIPGLPWVHEGTRVSSRWYAANLPGGIGEWIGADGNIKGEARDAGGWAETTVIAIDGDDVILKTTTFTYPAIGDAARKAPDHNGEPRFVAKANDNIFCKAPELLALEKADQGAGKIVRQVKWPVGDHLVDAIRIDKTSNFEYLLKVYDMKTGLGLELASLTPNGKGGTQLLKYTFASVRDVQVPWAKEPIPQAVRNMKSMRETGQITAQAGFGVRPTALTVDLSMVRSTDHWASVNLVSSAVPPGFRQPVAAAPQLAYYGPAEFGGLWIGPAAAAHLQQGQVLDDDAGTKTKTVVSRIDDKTITITEANGSTSVDKIYDRATGLMLGSDWFDTMTRFRTTLRVVP